MPDQPQQIDDLTMKILVAVISAFLAICVTLVVERWKKKLLVLKKRINPALIGMSNVGGWGDINITYNGNPVDNLFMVNVKIINDTGRDAPKNMIVNFSVPPGVYFLRDFGSLNNGDVNMGLKLEDGFFTRWAEFWRRWSMMSEPERAANHHVQAELDYYSQNREFVLPILNRKSDANFDFLVASNTRDNPTVIVGIYEPGVRLDVQEDEMVVKRGLFWKNIIITVVYIVFVWPVARYAPSIGWSAWLAALVSIPAYYVGLWLWMLLKFLKAI